MQARERKKHKNVQGKLPGPPGRLFLFARGLLGRRLFGRCRCCLGQIFIMAEMLAALFTCHAVRSTLPDVFAGGHQDVLATTVAVPLAIACPVPLTSTTWTRYPFVVLNSPLAGIRVQVLSSVAP